MTRGLSLLLLIVQPQRRTAFVPVARPASFAFRSRHDDHVNRSQRSFVSATHRTQYKRNEPRSILTSLFSSQKVEVDPGVVEGTDLRIVKYPHPSLRAKNDEVSITDEQESITKLAKEMFKVMYAAEGVGLAAPQVGVNKRLMVYNPAGDSQRWLDETIFVNPQIVEFSSAEDEEMEACLSFPDMEGEVVRSKWIKIEAFTPKGRKIKKKLKGWEARIFQHEYDHLDGTVYIDRLSKETREKVQPRLDELIDEYDGDDGMA
eukprot:CAMPEP_0194247138 /NCGR_PEP_ID=MMETSP0158-20130606/16107_1 /TAXON_ID=33649 /ORGANISM="Thalassionema nitzschioides, Strain L26-B" /LENGTH=260 /DNA_ID=CAMNT_0038983189 /DNA_START=35 /DNA_END=817 /DNA_ORIENTATION=+